MDHFSSKIILCYDFILRKVFKTNSEQSWKNFLTSPATFSQLCQLGLIHHSNFAKINSECTHPKIKELLLPNGNYNYTYNYTDLKIQVTLSQINFGKGPSEVKLQGKSFKRINLYHSTFKRVSKKAHMKQSRLAVH